MSRRRRSALPRPRRAPPEPGVSATLTPGEVASEKPAGVKLPKFKFNTKLPSPFDFVRAGRG